MADSADVRLSWINCRSDLPPLRMQREEAAMPYVDGFVVPVPKNKVEAYRAIAQKGAEIWKEHGALEVHEYLADDVKPGKVTSFPQSVNLKDDETVVFSWIVYPDRATRDRVNEKVMNDPRMKDSMNDMPFDGQRMIFGGFDKLVEM
jgi:uncharacterized protein YbaA (DUF1428 family)